MKAAVLYKSKHGSSKQYAVWLAESLQCKAEEVDYINRDELVSVDAIAYVGGLYAGQAIGFKKLLNHWDVLKSKKLALCLVGCTHPDETEKYRHMFERAVPEAYRGSFKPFPLRGDMMFSKLGFMERLMMNVPKSMAKKIPPDKRSKYDQDFLDNFGKDMRFVKRENLRDVLIYMKGKP